MFISEIIPQSIDNIIEEFNTNMKFNRFLYDNPDCNKLFKKLTSKDRFTFVNKQCDIEYKLTSFIFNNFHNKPCVVLDEECNLIKGIIRHELTRKFNNQIINNEVSFRQKDDTNEETIALWVITDDTFSTHLYTINNIVLY